MNRFRSFLLICALFFSGGAVYIIIANSRFLHVSPIPPACAMLDFGKNWNQPKNVIPSQFILSYGENIFHVVCIANYPTNIVLDDEEGMENLVKMWKLNNPKCRHGQGNFSTERNVIVYGTAIKFKVGFFCIPQCGSFECVERASLEYSDSGDDFISVESNALVWSKKTKEFAKSDVVHKEMLDARKEFKLTVSKVVLMIITFLIGVIICVCIFHQLLNSLNEYKDLPK